MELKKANKSWSYKQGFKKGLEIFANNHLQHGYFADEENEMTVRAFQHQIDTGVDKDGNKLGYNQIEWRKGVIDAINYKSGSSLQRREESPFERYERIHNYGERKPYDGTNWE